MRLQPLLFLIYRRGNKTGNSNHPDFCEEAQKPHYSQVVIKSSSLWCWGGLPMSYFKKAFKKLLRITDV